MQEIVCNKLAELVRRFGPDLCDNPKRCKALLRNVCGERKREIMALVTAAQEGVGGELRQSSAGVPKELIVARLAKRLCDNVGLAEDLACWAVESWAVALGQLAPFSIVVDPPVVPTSHTPTPLKIHPISPQTIEAGKLLKIKVTVEDSQRWKGRLRYGLVSSATPLARIDPQSGKFSWLPPSDQAVGKYDVTVVVQEPGVQRAQTTFAVRVIMPSRQPPLLNCRRIGFIVLIGWFLEPRRPSIPLGIPLETFLGREVLRGLWSRHELVSEF